MKTKRKTNKNPFEFIIDLIIGICLVPYLIFSIQNKYHKIEEQDDERQQYDKAVNNFYWIFTTLVLTVMFVIVVMTIIAILNLTWWIKLILITPIAFVVIQHFRQALGKYYDLEDHRYNFIRTLEDPTLKEFMDETRRIREDLERALSTDSR